MGELGAIVESAGSGSFFHTCLRILRGRAQASPHLTSKQAK
jgi:5-carboxymethyl-2-hydroxymuconate isomerase